VRVRELKHIGWQVLRRLLERCSTCTEAQVSTLFGGNPSSQMDVITAAAAMSAAISTLERHTGDEAQGPQQTRPRGAPDRSSTGSRGARAGGPQQASDTTAMPATPEPSSVALCPLCGNAAFKKGGLPEEVGIVARGQVGGDVAAGTGRYRIRKAPRKDNRLAAWYSRFGYRGPLYCKACSGTHRATTSFIRQARGANESRCHH
jgi:hypothetical protein